MLAGMKKCNMKKITLPYNKKIFASIVYDPDNEAPEDILEKLQNRLLIQLIADKKIKYDFEKIDKHNYVVRAEIIVQK